MHILNLLRLQCTLLLEARVCAYLSKSNNVGMRFQRPVVHQLPLQRLVHGLPVEQLARVLLPGGPLNHFIDHPVGPTPQLLVPLILLPRIDLLNMWQQSGVTPGRCARESVTSTAPGCLTNQIHQYLPQHHTHSAASQLTVLQTKIRNVPSNVRA